MLRLTNIKYVDEPTAMQTHSGEEFEPFAKVTFEGDAGDFGYAEIVLSIKQRGSEDALLRRAREVLAEAIGQLHEEVGSAQPGGD